MGGAGQPTALNSQPPKIMTTLLFKRKCGGMRNAVPTMVELTISIPMSHYKEYQYGKLNQISRFKTVGLPRVLNQIADRELLSLA
jgi:hypothetical protein